MADNVIRVNVTTVAPKSVTIQGSKEQNYINATGDTSGYNAQLAKNWAIGEGKIQGIDYSSKHYAGVAKENAELASENLNNVQEIVAGFGETAGNATSELAQVKNDALIDISNLNSSVIEGVESSKDTAISAINTAKTEGLTAIQTEGKKQVENIESTGFYMRDDKLYFINSKGEEEEFKSGGSGYAMFDTVLKDHVLTYEESKGLALQGTYVYKEAVAGSRYGYPDFYAKCLEEKNAGTATEVTLAGTTITMYISSNGHAYYNIADKSVIDTCFSVLGMAWWYGIDTENERVFLPRNNWFEQATGDVSEINTHVEAGLPNITGDFWGYPLNSAGGHTGAGAFSGTSVTTKDCSVVGSSNYRTLMDFNASLSNPIYGKSNTVQPNAVKKLLYICVGNTESQSSVTDVVDVTTTENDTLPLFAPMYFDFAPNNVSWLRAGEQANNAGIYKFTYSELVKELTSPKYGIKVIETANMVSGEDYSLYWKVNQDDMTFITPLSDGSGIRPDWKNLQPLHISVKSSSYTITQDGYYTLWLSKDTASAAATMRVNGNVVQVVNITDAWQETRLPIFLSKGDVVSSEGYVYDAQISNYIPTTNNGSLYFKVANAVQNLELLDAGEVLEAVNNVVPNNSSLICGLAMPSNKYIDLTLGASGTYYDVPADGYIEFVKAATANNQVVSINVLKEGRTTISSNDDVEYGFGHFLPNYNFLWNCTPIAKGRRFRVFYDAGGDLIAFRFIYAKGSESEV